MWCAINGAMVSSCASMTRQSIIDSQLGGSNGGTTLTGLSVHAGRTSHARFQPCVSPQCQEYQRTVRAYTRYEESRSSCEQAQTLGANSGWYSAARLSAEVSPVSGLGCSMADIELFSVVLLETSENPDKCGGRCRLRIGCICHFPRWRLSPRQKCDEVCALDCVRSRFIF